jgi:hypothetical protein
MSSMQVRKPGTFYMTKHDLINEIYGRRRKMVSVATSDDHIECLTGYVSGAMGNGPHAISVHGRASSTVNIQTKALQHRKSSSRTSPT